MSMTEEAIAAFTALLGDRFTTARGVRDQHRPFQGPAGPDIPDAVAFAETSEEVAGIVKTCATHGIPLIPYGVGTSVEGHVAAPSQGLALDLSRMDKIRAVNAEDLDCTVETGVTREDLNHHLRDMGLMFPIDPGANATIGGMAATRASGTNAVRYGTMMTNVLSLKVVLPDGRIIKTGTRARKSAAGYDLTRLFVGSEGTLGVITEVSLRLHGIPEAVSSAVCSFPMLEDAVNTTILTIQSGIPIARIELLDELEMKACNLHSGLGYPEQPTLFFEFHGSEAGVKEQAEAVESIAAEFGGTDFLWATKTEDRNRLWKARHEAYFAGFELKPGADVLTTDVCVPISRLAECILETRQDLDESGIVAPIVGHVGDGNFHVQLLIDPEKPEEYETAEALNSRIVDRALKMDGTSTGEHGIGLGKRDKLIKELGEDAVAVMRSLKSTLDPQNIMNPGKIFLE